MNLEIAAAYYKLGHLTSADLVSVALANIESHNGSSTLRLLAGETNPLMCEVGPLFEKSLSEEGILLPTPDTAANSVARFVAEKIIRNELSPYEGAREIWKVAYNSVRDLDHLAIFVGAASEIEDLPGRYLDSPSTAAKYIAEYEEDIRKAAAKLVGRQITSA